MKETPLVNKSALSVSPMEGVKRCRNTHCQDGTEEQEHKHDLTSMREN